MIRGINLTSDVPCPRSNGTGPPPGMPTCGCNPPDGETAEIRHICCCSYAINSLLWTQITTLSQLLGQHLEIYFLAVGCPWR